MNKDAIRELIFEGCSVSYKDISVCDLRAHLPQVMHHSRQYQVWSRDHSEVTKDLDKAIDMFVELVEQKKKRV